MKRFAKLALLFIFVALVVFGSTTLQASKDALTLWFEKLVPSMFVTLVFVRILYHQRILERLFIPFLPRLLNMNDACISFVLCCMFLGFPNGALLIDEDYQKHRINQQEAKRLLYTCSFPAPGFVILSCGTLLFHSTTIGLYMFLAQIVSGIVLMFCTRGTRIERLPIFEETKLCLSTCVSKSIIESGKSLYMIGGYLLLFVSITNIIFQFLPNTLSLPLRIVAEFSSGTQLIQLLPFSTTTHSVLTCMLLSFGGFCVHMQVCSMAEHITIRYTHYVFFRIVQSILSALMFLLFLILSK